MPIAVSLNYVGRNDLRAVVVVEQLPQLLLALYWDMAGIVADQEANNGVRVILGDGVREFVQVRCIATEAILESGRRLQMDFVIVFIAMKTKPSQKNRIQASTLFLGGRPLAQGLPSWLCSICTKERGGRLIP